ncbi:hypothetical protein MSAN_01120700 [Mycena sanguinolenta]|uniref:Uncharacterized protein n=1 Tax=Mycena sanguinolenta TaxID=230812 RepID=A0A8H6YJD4_9AGAR|nr:hypothetical protein MSAN_01120700 [Mycena sanguinolenta]
MLDNPDLDDAFDTTPYVHLDANGKHHWSDFMSANFAWHHCDRIYEDDPSTEVAMGDIEYHPAYISLGNPHNNIRRAHHNTVMPFIFLPIPKSAYHTQMVLHF